MGRIFCGEPLHIPDQVRDRLSPEMLQPKLDYARRTAYLSGDHTRRSRRCMNRFAALLDRLAYEPSRNAKLRLLTDYFRATGDPDRGYALAAITGALSFRHAKAGAIRAL